MPSDALHRHIAARVRELLRKKRWSQNQLADFAGLSHAQVSRLLSCQQSPTVATLNKIAVALNVSLRELFQ